MKSLRHVVLLSLVVMLLASCVGLPPVFPNRAPSPQDVEEPAGAAPAAQPPVDEAKPAITESTAVTATTAITDTAVIAATDTVTTTAPTEAQATPTGEQVMGANPLVGVVWEWSALLKTKPAVQSVVPDPASYTVVFTEDAKVAIKADCNNASGAYTLENDLLTITIGPMTRAACPPGSLSDLMVGGLSKVSSYLIDGGDLILRMADTGDSMLFRNGGPVTVPAAPAPTEAPAAAAPAQTPAAPAETTAQATALVGPVWQWQKFVDVATGKNTMDVKNPADYTVTFRDDRTVAMKADCNQAAGTYAADGAKLTINVGPVTLAACGPDSVGEEFLIGLTSAATYTIEGGQLMIDLMADGGRMIFGAAQ